MAWRDLGHHSAASAGRLPGPGLASSAGRLPGPGLASSAGRLPGPGVASSAGRLPGPGVASSAGLGLRRSAMEPAPAARRLSRRRLAADFLLVNDEVLRPPV